MRVGAPERRHGLRGTPQGEPPRFDLVNLITGSYREMPGLSLTLSQAARLFGVSARTCEVVLTDLVRTGVLRRSDDGRYKSNLR